jgi:undecaprenyl diphosphate synthase
MEQSTIPAHIGIIMDGNRRWAKAKSLPTLEGHRQGYETFLTIAEHAFDRGIRIFSVFAFSTENWKRSEEEVRYLMKLLRKAVTGSFDRFHEKGIKILISGRIDELPDGLAQSVRDVMKKTAQNKKGILNIALNYGGRAELIDAMKRMLKEDVKPEDVTEDLVQSYLYQPEIPDLDLIIRTSGEQRTSGFFPWQGVYAEFLFVKKHWPDFSPKDLDVAIEDYANRHRRFGGN